MGKMLGWGHVMAAQEYRNDQVRKAEAWRFRQQAANQNSINPWYYRVLSGLGNQLSLWGEQLKERYAEACAEPLNLSVDMD